MSTKGGREDGGTLGTGLGPWKPGLRIRIRIIFLKIDTYPYPQSENLDPDFALKSNPDPQSEKH
jgi:hypothetical protein